MEYGVLLLYYVRYSVCMHLYVLRMCIHKYVLQFTDKPCFHIPAGQVTKYLQRMVLEIQLDYPDK